MPASLSVLADTQRPGGLFGAADSPLIEILVSPTMISSRGLNTYFGKPSAPATSPDTKPPKLSCISASSCRRASGSSTVPNDRIVMFSVTCECRIEGGRLLRSPLNRDQKSPVQMPAVFDEAYYLRNNPDVARRVREGAIRNGMEHYKNSGMREGRLPSPLPDVTGRLVDTKKERTWHLRLSDGRFETWTLDSDTNTIVVTHWLTEGVARQGSPPMVSGHVKRWSGSSLPSAWGERGAQASAVPNQL